VSAKTILGVRFFQFYTLMAYFQEEKGSSFVKSLLEKASKELCNLYFCVINLGEVLYIIEKEKGLLSAQLALSRIKELPVKIIVVGEEITLKAAHIKANFPVSYADCFAAAVSIIKNATLVTGDPEFKTLENLVNISWI